MSQLAVNPIPKDFVPLPETKASLRLNGLDHLAIVVGDLVEAERWYVEVVGAEIVTRYNWGGDTEHDVLPHVDVRIGRTLVSLFVADQGPKRHRLVHHAYDCNSLEEWDTWRAHVESCGVSTIGPTGHDGFSLMSLHFDDPWGNGFEIMVTLSDPESAERAILERNGAITGRVAAAESRP